MTLAAALLAAAAAATAVPSRAVAERVERLHARPSRPTAGAGPRGSPRSRRQALDRVRRWVVAGMAGAAVAVLVGESAGTVSGLLVAVVLARWLARLEPAEERRRRERLEAAVPVVADLVATCVEAGCPPPVAVAAVAEALGDPVEGELVPALVDASLGVPPRDGAPPIGAPLAPIGRALARAARTGAAPAAGLRLLAEDARNATRSTAEVRARSTGTRAAAPVGLCLLPAFVLCGVVPLVGSLVLEVLT